MATDTMTTLANLFKVVYEPEMGVAFNEEVQGLQLAQKKTKPFAGGAEVMSVTVGRSRGVGSRQETQGLPTPGGVTQLQATIPLSRLYKVFELSHDVIERSKGDQAAFKEALGQELEAGLDRMKKEFNFQFYGDGRGARATVVTGGDLAQAAGSTAQYVFDTTRYLEVGDIVTFWTTVAGATVVANMGQSDALDSEQVSVQSVDSATKATFVRAITATAKGTAAGANVVRLYGDSTTDGATRVDNYIAGLRLIGDTGALSATFEGINRTTQARWQGQLITATGLDLTRDILYRLGDKIRRNSGGRMNTLIWDASMRREYLEIIQPDVRVAPVKDLDAGYDEEALVLSVGGRKIRLVEDFDVPAGVVYGFDSKHLFWLELSPFEVDMTTGSYLKQATPYGRTGSGDIFYGYMRLKGNIATNNAGAFGCVIGLNNSFATE